MPDWDNAQAGTIFEQMLTETDGKIDGVLAANDGLGNAAISVLKKNKLNGKVPVTGQDADRPGPAEHPRRRPVHDRLQGGQEGGRRGRRRWPSRSPRARRRTTGQTVEDPEGNRDVPSVLLTPKAITKDNVKDVIADGYVTKASCAPATYAQALRRGRHQLSRRRSTDAGDRRRPARQTPVPGGAAATGARPP